MSSVGVSLKVKVKVRSLLGDVLDKRMINKSELARFIGAEPKQLYGWCKNGEDGQATSTPSVGYLLRLTKFLGVPIEEMYEEV